MTTTCSTDLLPVTGFVALPVRAEVVEKRPWGERGDSPAYLNLSPNVVAVLISETGHLLSQIDLWDRGLSVKQAWDSAAYTLLERQNSHRVEFQVRNASCALGTTAPRGFEIAPFDVPAVAWLSHPKTFQMLHQHFLEVLVPKTGLVYVTRDQRDLFVLDTTIEAAAKAVPQATVMTYSLGFPVVTRV
ncbi:hypothetical protein KBX19_06230 [Corynebacterium sp. CCUG 71335]|uniref:hypothetical protein n=1 Tax=unclassified Corynebacterium TaxID=2624378 RepID=UPI00210E070D|nr:MULTISPECIES: hypothetical protein [unclassified Corynebacterium]MCQ4620808.1 hypothetical protein [Corynebacterium sp. CCUG 71335]MCQ4622772.1 hypothetical protein [Corynebacterium sp. CCUG 70398]MCQ4624631.1 hypothetical protein [Corynebacterium sp. CCUG 69979]MCQ4626645.1 hypothetical protein [Corynebacterium sp. CCUG 65737]